MSQHTMPEQHTAILQTLLGLGEADPLPGLTENKYWQLKRCFDRVSEQVTIRDLAILAFECGHGLPFGGEGDISLVDQFRRKELAYGTPCECLWKKAWRPGKLIGTSADRKLIVEIDGDSEERTLNAAQVRLVEVLQAA